MISIPRNEAKYQMLKLIHSGRTLGEAKAIVRATAMGLDPEYASEKDLTDLASLEGGLHSIATNRESAKQLAKIRFQPRKAIAKTREEAVAAWLTSYSRGAPLNWKRDGNLIRRGRPNKPKPGSSKGKIGKTRVRGADKTLKEFRKLIAQLSALQKIKGRGNTKALQQAYRSVRKQVSASVKGSTP